MEAALKTYAENLSFERNSAEVATLVHRSAYDAMGVKDPYIELKIRADEIAEGYLEGLEKMISVSDDPMRTAIRISIIGNIMDFGSGIAIDDPNEFEGMFSDLLDQEIKADDTEMAKSLIERSGTVIYVFDNCGESQFDKLLIREIRKKGKKVVGVVRGEPILNDVSLDDAMRIGLEKEVDELLTTGGFAIGMDMRTIPDELKERICEAGIMIAKGMANYESLSDVDINIPVAYILKAKCGPVADSLGVNIGDNVVKIQ